jgi:hypothetical protein
VKDTEIRNTGSWLGFKKMKYNYVRSSGEMVSRIKRAPTRPTAPLVLKEGSGWMN